MPVTKPTPGGSNGTWGAELNAALTELDTRTDPATLSATYVARADRQRRDSGYGVTRCITSPGKLVASFGRAGEWDTPGSGATVTDNYTGYDVNGVQTGIVSRTGQYQMRQVVPTVDTSVSFRTVIGSTAIRTPQLINGQFVLIVHIANQPGYGAGASPTGIIHCTMTTQADGATGNGVWVRFNVNGLHEGWNFLKFRMRNPAAYTSGSSQTEYHPNGIWARGLGTGAAANIVNSPITRIECAAEALNGATVTFDSIRTGIGSVSDVILGPDQATNDTRDLALPLFQAKGWKGYFAVPLRIMPTSADRRLDDLNVDMTVAKTLYNAGWDCVNHTINHLPGAGSTPTMATLTNAAEINYEVTHARGWYNANGLLRGTEFYASPRQVTSRLAEKVIKDAGFVVQRHAKKPNITVTPWGIDNPAHIGSFDIGWAAFPGLTYSNGALYGGQNGGQTFTNIKRIIDVMEAYGDAFMPFWHTVTTLGDTGSGEDLTGNDLIITQSALSKTFDYIAEREAAGGLRVRDGFTGWYYGVGR